MKTQAQRSQPVRDRLLGLIRTSSEVAYAALLTWLFFMALQVVAMRFISEGI
jgi:hypothetical protein